MNFRDLRFRLRALLAPGRVERELDEELGFHIDRETEKLVATGLDREVARAQARARFGSLTVAADECRDARRLGLLDTTARDVVYAGRTIRRAPIAALTIVTTVGVGLGLVASVFTLFNMFAFRVDAVPNPHELFEVERPRTDGGPRPRFTRLDYDSLRRDTSVFRETAAMLPDLDMRIEGRMMGGTLVTGSFFQMAGVRAAQGRALTPADDDRTAPQPVMVLSHTGWVRELNSDPGIVGRALTVNGAPHTVIGVMPEGFRGLSVGAPDYWAPLANLAQFRPIHAGHEDQVAVEIVGRLEPGLAPDAAVAGLTAWAVARTPGAPPANGPLITLKPRQGNITDWGEMLLVVTPLFFAFGSILLIGCANVANLLLARAISRRREIGIRLSLGAARLRIVRQLLTESLLLALAAALLGFVVSRLVFAVTIHFVMATLAPELAENIRLSMPAADWRVAAFLIGGAVASTVFFGLLPALQATRLELVRTIRGEITRDARPGRARQALIGLQVTASAVLLVCAGVFLRSTLQAATFDPGFRTADVILVDIVNEPPRSAMVSAVRAQPGVAAVAAMWPELVSRPRAAFVQPATARAAAPTGTAMRSPAAYRFVSPEFFAVLDVPVRHGRTFTAAESDGAAVAIIAETLARQLWPGADAIGRLLQIDLDPSPEARRADEPPLQGRAFTIVGVARDVPGLRFAGYKEADLYLPTTASEPGASLLVRVDGNADAIRRALLDRLTVIDPNMGEVMTLQTLASLEIYLLQFAFWLTTVLGGLALVLTLSGLFSVLSYLVEQRTKELAVRIALGATTRQVAGVVLSQSAAPVATGILAGVVMAALLAMLLLSTELASLIGDSVHIFDPVAYGASVIVITVACIAAAAIPALRAARIDPMTTLRQE